MTTKKKSAPRSECVFSNILDVLGDKWTLLIIRDLFFWNKHEFKDFLASPEAIATNILSDRLKKLLSSKIIAEQVHPENKSRKLYYLTEKGKDLLPILVEMAKWGTEYFPELPAMQSLYRRIKEDPKGLTRRALKATAEWEQQNISSTARQE
jgi:DNA-binding HxlR family transcriptional regulator